MATTRDQAVGILQDGHERLSGPIAGLSDADLTRRATLGGGDWSVQDLMGHVAAWEGRALEALDRWRRGEAVEVMAGVAAVDAFNARHVETTRARTLSEVREDARSTHDRLVEELHGLSEREWRSLVTMSNGRRHRLGTLLGGITGGPGGSFRHAWAHLPDLEAFVTSLSG
jgi:hypothetical protein